MINHDIGGQIKGQRRLISTSYLAKVTVDLLSHIDDGSLKLGDFFRTLRLLHYLRDPCPPSNGQIASVHKPSSAKP